MTSPGDAGGEPRSVASRKAPTWPRVAVVGALLVLAFVVSRSCQASQIEVTQEEAVATAEQQVDFTPQNTQIRLLRQGLDRRPFWIVSLSIPFGDSEDSFRQLAVVRVDAITGEVAELLQESAAQRGRHGERGKQ